MRAHEFITEAMKITQLNKAIELYSKGVSINDIASELNLSPAMIRYNLSKYMPNYIRRPTKKLSKLGMETINKAIELYSSGSSLSAISSQLNAPVETIRHNLIKHMPDYEDIKKKYSSSWDAEKTNQLVNAYRYGMPINDIAVKMGMSTANVKKRLYGMSNIEELKKEHEKNSQFRVNFSKEQGVEIINMYVNGIGPYNMAEKLNVSGKSIIKFLQSQKNYESLKSQHESNIKYKRVWKPEEISDIVNSYRNGITVGELAKKHGASSDGIEGILSRQENFDELKADNIKNSKKFINWTPELVNNIIDMYSKGDTIENIAKTTNISMAVVYSKIKSQPNFAELKTTHDNNAKHIFKWTEDKIAEVLNMYSSGKSYKFIANHYGLSDTPIKRIIQNQPNYNELKRIHDSNM